MKAQSIPQEDRPEEPKKVLRLAKLVTDPLETIQNLATNRWYVNEDASLLELADDFTAYPAIPAVAVTDNKGKLLGQIVRHDLLDLLGRPFGRDVLKKETVVRVARNTKTFKHTESILNVCEEIAQGSFNTESDHYPLKTAKGEFSGIFSLQDLLLHLAASTKTENEATSAFRNRILKETQLIEKNEYDVLATTLRTRNGLNEFCHIRQYDKDSWNLTLCTSSTEQYDNNLLVTLLWGVVNSFDFHKGLMNYVRHLNTLIFKTFEPQAGLHGLFMDYQAKSGSIMLCDHENGAGYIYRAGQFMRMKTAESSSALGLSSQLSTEIFRYQLQAGDTVFILGGGMATQENSEGKLYGPAQIKSVLESNAMSTIRQLRNLIVADFKNFRGNILQQRDAALVMIRIK